jgi:tetratricopeptide (TPR) repeat protein
MGLTYSHGREFVRQVLPIIERRHVDGLARHLHQFWTNRNLCDLLSCGHDDAAKLALACLCVTGTLADAPAVVRVLRHEDETTTMLAEHTLWSIWFQSGDAHANRCLMQAVRLIASHDFARAVDRLDQIVAQYPEFAEAYNQRAIAYFFLGAYARAAADCEQTLRLNQHHFGAMAGLGHCCASLGRLHDALRAYRRALGVHPRLEGVCESIHHVRQYLDRTGASRPSWITET